LKAQWVSSKLSKASGKPLQGTSGAFVTAFPVPDIGRNLAPSDYLALCPGNMERRMASFLRDQHVQNVSFDSQALAQLNNVFAERFGQLQAELVPGGKQAFLTYIIRFDGKGYKVFSLEELLRYFDLAHKVERVIFTVESGDSQSSNRMTGAYLELCLDEADPMRCTLISSSDDKDWAEASFAAVQDVLLKHRTKYGIARSTWVNLVVQMLGVVVGFTASLWLALKVAPNLKIENPFVIAFLFTLLVFSNVWGYLNQGLLRFIAKTFPNVEFIRPNKAQMHWLLQAIVGSATFAAVVYVLGLGASFLSRFLSGLLNAGA
jgi:hypothetical protein